MQSLRFSWYCFCFILLTACQNRPAPEVVSEPDFAFDRQAVADKLGERMNIQAGERVLLVAKPGDFDSLILLIRAHITQAHAQDLGVISVAGQAPKDWNTEFTTGAKGKNQAELADYFQDVDLGLMLPGAATTDTPYAAMQDVLRQGKGRTLHFHWSGAYDLDGKPLPPDDAIDACYQKALLETDYEALGEAQKTLEAAMRGQVVRVTTPLGTDIRFEIGDRPLTRQDGDASAARARNLIDREIELPAGAIRYLYMDLATL